MSVFYFFLMNRRPPNSTPYPSTALFRSPGAATGDDGPAGARLEGFGHPAVLLSVRASSRGRRTVEPDGQRRHRGSRAVEDRKSTRLNSSHANISYAVLCLKKNRNRKQCL